MSNSHRAIESVDIPRSATLARLRDDLALSVVARALAGLDGSLALTLPSGRTGVIGRGPDVRAALALRSYALLWRSIRRGTLGFADAYLSGDVETHDLSAVFQFFIDNRETLTRTSRGLMRGRRADRLFHHGRANTRDGSRRNIAAHYDLGNAFYGLWLDDSMMYSSGIYRNPEDDLEVAQRTKIGVVLDALNITAGRRVLEIGCGWGEMAIAMARAGADVAAITVSREQHNLARQRVLAAGVQDRVDVRFEDYRDVAGSFDRIVSIEMIEAVGQENWPVYFSRLRDLLMPGGTAVVQAITIREQSFESYRARPDFIQRYIFPGGMLPTKTALAEEGAAAGLGFETICTFGASYARTCADWLQRFEANWSDIAALGFDERFRRMWRYYLQYCEAGFSRGVIDVGLYRFTKPA
jgi:cyclopropane-fatty-acyl-phospholipid synthase